MRAILTLALTLAVASSPALAGGPRGSSGSKGSYSQKCYSPKGYSSCHSSPYCPTPCHR